MCGVVKRAVVLLIACSGGEAEPPPAPPPVKPDAAVAPPPAPLEPINVHVDDDVPRKPPTNPAQKHPSHPIDITLRSSPSGARASVDGTVIGVTPTYWSGEADGREHTFVFVYEPQQKTGQRYALAQYRFVPVTSGVIHARLEPIASDENQPQPPPEVVPPPAPPPPSAPPPPTATPDAWTGMGPQP